MPNKNYLKGRRFEYEVMNELRANGFSAMRTSGSHGHFDVIGIKLANGQQHIKFIQCKVIQKYSASAMKKLILDFNKNTPVVRSYNYDDLIVEAFLYIKYKDSNKYNTYVYGA